MPIFPSFLTTMNAYIYKFCILNQDLIKHQMLKIGIKFIIECIYIKKYYKHTIKEILFILLCCNLYYYYCILPLHIYRKGWLTNKLKPPNYYQLIILNLISKSSAVRTLISLPATGLLYPSPKWTLLLLPPTSSPPPVVQPSRPTIQ